MNPYMRTTQQALQHKEFLTQVGIEGFSDIMDFFHGIKTTISDYLESLTALKTPVIKIKKVKVHKVPKNKTILDYDWIEADVPKGFKGNLHTCTREVNRNIEALMSVNTRVIDALTRYFSEIVANGMSPHASILTNKLTFVDASKMAEKMQAYFVKGSSVAVQPFDKTYNTMQDYYNTADNMNALVLTLKSIDYDGLIEADNKLGDVVDIYLGLVAAGTIAAPNDKESIAKLVHMLECASNEVAMLSSQVYIGLQLHAAYNDTINKIRKG